MKSVCVGPFIGSFECEVLQFLPYVKYLANTLTYDNFYVSGYSNRRFLYDWILDVDFFPVYESGTRSDHKQIGYIHEDVSSTQYSQLVTSFQKYVIDDLSCSIKDIDMYVPTYTRYMPPTNNIQKKFTPTNQIKNINFSDIVVFIPDESIDEVHNQIIYNSLKIKYNVVVVGDCKTNLYQYNDIMKRMDYTDKVYELVIEYIQKANAVIVPCSYWTILCNIHETPVLSWGDIVGPYKTNGTFGFGNKNMIINSQKHINIDVLDKAVEYFIENVRVKCR